MKKLFLFSFVLLLFPLQSAFSQIKVDSTGFVGINNTDPSNNLDIKGTMKIITNPDQGLGLIIDNSYDISGPQFNFPAFYPFGGCSASLGKEGSPFSVGHFQDLNSGLINSGTINNSGSIFTQELINYSDGRLKTNTSKIDSALFKIKQLNPVKYNYSEEFFSNTSNLKSAEKKKNNKKNLGFIAQEILPVFPELVEKDSDSSYYGVNYIGMIPVIVEAMKEQQKIIEAQNLKIKELEQLFNQESEDDGNLKSTANSEDGLTTNAFLYQNTPNPFTHDTEIRFFIPEEAQKSNLYVFDLQGRLLMNKPVNAKGDGSLTINGTELKPGMYIYSLHIDGHEVDTKRMVLTE